MLTSPPREPELCTDLFWEQEHFWLNPVRRAAAGKMWKIQLFLLVLPLVCVHHRDVLNLVIGWEGSAGPLSRLQLPPGALSFRGSPSGMCVRDLVAW